MSQPLVIAHRGASIYARENTLPAFEKAIALGSDMVEFDVRRTRDKVMVVYHDPDLNGQLIRKLTFAEIQSINPSIPTLEAVLQLCQGRIRLDVELKEAGYEKELVNLLLRYFQRDEFVITSFHPIAVKKIKQKFPDLTVGFLFGDLTIDFCHSLKFDAKAVYDRIRLMEADFIAPDWQLLDTELLSQVVHTGLPIWVWTVNDAEPIQRLLNDPRIEAIITDNPELGMEWRDRTPVVELCA